MKGKRTISALLGETNPRLIGAGAPSQPSAIDDAFDEAIFGTQESVATVIQQVHPRIRHCVRTTRSLVSQRLYAPPQTTLVDVTQRTRLQAKVIIAAQHTIVVRPHVSS
jgi:hypothetical protein